MSIHAAKGALIDTLKELNARWERVKGEWDDDASRRLTGEIVDPLTPRVAAASKGIEDLAALLSAARRECGDDEA